MPDQEAPFDECHHRIDEDHEDRQDGHAGENAGHVEDAFRLVNLVAKACRGAEIFPDDRAYEVFQEACAQGIDSLRLFKLYARVQAFEPLRGAR